MEKKPALKRLRPEARGLKKILGDLEAQVMEEVWKKKKASVKEIHQSLCEKKGLAYTTVMTVMDRLAKKGYLRRKKAGRSYIYEPALTQEKLSFFLAESVVGSFFKEFGSSALLSFLEKVVPEDEELLEKLEKIVAFSRQKERQRKK
jgi:predicted transcriptional regulator